MEPAVLLDHDRAVLVDDRGRPFAGPAAATTALVVPAVAASSAWALTGQRPEGVIAVVAWLAAVPVAFVAGWLFGVVRTVRVSRRDVVVAERRRIGLSRTETWPLRDVALLGTTAMNGEACLVLEFPHRMLAMPGPAEDVERAAALIRLAAAEALAPLPRGSAAEVPAELARLGRDRDA